MEEGKRTEMNGGRWLSRTFKEGGIQAHLLNTLLITSIYQRCISLTLIEKNYNTSPRRSFIEIEPRFEFYTSLSLCLLSSPVCFMSLNLWLHEFCIVLSDHVSVWVCP